MKNPLANYRRMGHGSIVDGLNGVKGQEFLVIQMAHFRDFRVVS